jgi:MoaA/NifB/PqqE/SkfB family radical SAM enzyme
VRVGEFAVSVPTGTSPREDLVGLAATATPLASPVEAYFEVANRCNSKCATCPLTFSPQEDARQLSLDEFKSLVAQLPDLRRAVLQGIGEPLLNHELPAMIRHLDERGVYTVFNTNAALLTRRRQVDLVHSGLDELRVSLDSSTPETYLKIRGIPAFERVVANVGEMVRTRRLLESRTPRISIWMTGLRENLAELPDVIDLAARLGVDEVYVQRLVFWGEGLATPDQSIFGHVLAEAEGIIAEAERRAARHGLSFRGADALSPRASLLERPPQAEPWRACSRPLRLAYVTAQGTALPCCIAPFTDAPFDTIRLGNYLQDGVAGVWHGAAYERFRQQLYSSEPPPSCRNCGLAWSL